MAGEKINILLIEDNKDDILLLQKTLTQSGLQFTLFNVIDKTEFILHFEQPEIKTDLIISDYNLPQFDGLEALQYVRMKDQSIPFIFLTGFLGEERALHLIKCGANDFFLKEHIDRIPQSITRLLEEAELKKEKLLFEKELAQKNATMNTLMESVVDLIFLKDIEQKYLEVNSEFCAFFKLKPEQIIGKTDAEIFDVSISKKGRETDLEVLKNRKPVNYEVDYLTENKRYVLETVKTPIKSSGTNISGIVGITRDITNKKVDEEAIRTSQLQLAQSEKQSLSGSFEFDSKNQLLYCSHQLLKNLGFFKLNRLLKFEDLLERVYQPERQIFLDEFNLAIKQKREFSMDHRCVKLNDHRIIYCRTHLIPDIKRHDEGIFFGVLADVTHDRYLRSAIIEIQERERKDIAANLHDSLGQKLVASKMFLSDLESTNSQSTRARELIDQSIQEIRNLSKNLAFAPIQGQGLKVAILDVVSNIPKKIAVELDLDFTEEKISDDISINLFRIIQEGITNIIKYSEGTKVVLKMEDTDYFISLIITDNGIGFNTHDRSSGNGLRNFHERVSKCQGVIKITSSKDKGTTIAIKVPFE